MCSSVATVVDLLQKCSNAVGAVGTKASMYLGKISVGV